VNNTGTTKGSIMK